MPIGDQSQQELFAALNDLMETEKKQVHQASSQMKSIEINKSVETENSQVKLTDQGQQVLTLETDFGTNSDVINQSRSNDNFVTGITGTSIDIDTSFDVEIQRKKRRYQPAQMSV